MEPGWVRARVRVPEGYRQSVVWAGGIPYPVVPDDRGEAEVALVFRWQGDPSFARLRAFADGLKLGVPETIRRRWPLFVVLDGDVAHSVGALLREDEDVAGEVMVIDGILLQDFDFIDIGRKLEPSNTVPVTVKSLVFHGISDDRGI